MRELSRSLFAIMQKAHLSWVGVRYAHWHIVRHSLRPSVFRPQSSLTSNLFDSLPNINKKHRTKFCVFCLARDEGIEPPPAVLETVILPLYESRKNTPKKEYLYITTILILLSMITKLLLAVKSFFLNTHLFATTD